MDAQRVYRISTTAPPAASMSCSNRDCMVGLDGGIFERCQNVVFFEERIVLKNFLMGSARAEQAQNICDTNALTADARAPAAFAGFDGDSVK